MRNSRCLASLLAFAVTALSCARGGDAGVPVYMDQSRSLDERVEDALSRMTLEEKVGMLHAQSKFSSAGVPRLGIPELWTTDGPHGIRPEVLWDEWNQAGWTNDSCVAFPALTCLAATWDVEMSALYGKSIGEEARYREKDVLLGPGVNILRTPLNGRNFEYMGEDPCLASVLVVPYVREVQKNGVAACVKHFALNNQEANRHRYDAVVDDRTLHEIYLPAFKAAVQEGGAWSVMGSYNRYKGQYACHNQVLLNDILKRDWGFDGAVISDWGGTEDTDEAIACGLDIEFGTFTDGLSLSGSGSYDSYHLADPYLEKLRSGEAAEDVLDDKVRRVLRLNFRTAMNSAKPYGSFCSPEHDAAARKIASSGMVLLKNDGVLPIDAGSVSRILVVGENAVKMMTVGGGSSSLKARVECSPLEGIADAAGDLAQVVYERGYVGDTGGFQDGLSSGQDLSESRSPDRLVADAVAAAAEADVVIFVGGLNKSPHQDCEDSDRFGLGLPYGQDEVIEALASAGKKLVVVLVSGNPVAMPWVDRADAVLEAWYSGSQAGYALADILFGKVNPSGKLPFTFPEKLEDNGAHALGAYDPAAESVEYREGIYVGYRWAEKNGVRPLFAFGHGLSYTEFSYGQASCDRKVMRVPANELELSDSEIVAGASGRNVIHVSVDVTNVGDRAGEEVVQLYISDDECSVDRPVKELKAFRKVGIEPGQTASVTLEITPDMLRWYDAGKGRWVLEKGLFTAHVGSASDDIRTSVQFEVR